MGFGKPFDPSKEDTDELERLAERLVSRRSEGGDRVLRGVLDELDKRELSPKSRAVLLRFIQGFVHAKGAKSFSYREIMGKVHATFTVPGAPERSRVLADFERRGLRRIPRLTIVETDAEEGEQDGCQEIGVDEVLDTEAGGEVGEQKIEPVGAKKESEL